MYLIKTPKIVKNLFHRGLTWSIPFQDKQLFLTFDDGPTVELNTFILEQLHKYNAKATFFCVGENAETHPHLIQDIINEGHSIGNHTHNHLNGWKTSTNKYVENVKQANTHLQTPLFRPPYGRIKRKQIAALKKDYTIVMWSILSGDFDTSITPEHCLKNLMRSQAGDIIVMHDNIKAKDKLYYSLPLFLKHYTEKGYEFLPLMAIGC